jgi:CheY-like chemotaxis protein
MPVSKQLNLLLVEDDPHIRELAAVAARHSGNFDRIYVAENGDAALKLIWHELRERGPDGEPPDIVLTDLSMPQLDGIALIRELKSHASTRGIPIAMMTSSNRPNDREDAMQAGCCLFFEKPVRFADFVTLINLLPTACAQPTQA